MQVHLQRGRKAGDHDCSDLSNRTTDQEEGRQILLAVLSKAAAMTLLMAMEDERVLDTHRHRFGNSTSLPERLMTRSSEDGQIKLHHCRYYRIRNVLG